MMNPSEWKKQCDKMDKIIKIFDERRSKLDEDVKRAKIQRDSYEGWEQIDLHIKEFNADLVGFHERINKVLNCVPTDFLSPEYISAQKRIPLGIVRVNLILKHTGELLKVTEMQRQLIRRQMSMGEGLLMGLKENGANSKIGSVEPEAKDEHGKSILREHRHDPVKIVLRAEPKAEDDFSKPKNQAKPAMVDKPVATENEKGGMVELTSFVKEDRKPGIALATKEVPSKLEKLPKVNNQLVGTGEFLGANLKEGMRLMGVGIIKGITDGYFLLKKGGGMIIDGIIFLPVSAYNLGRYGQIKKPE